MMKIIAAFTSRHGSSLFAMPSKLTRINDHKLMPCLNFALVAVITTSPAVFPNVTIVSNAATKSTATQTASVPSAKSEIDPEAVATLEKMGAYLGTLKTYQVRANTTTEDVLEDSQKIQYDATTDVLVQMPDKLRVEHTGDRLHRLYLYDGRRSRSGLRS